MVYWALNMMSAIFLGVIKLLLGIYFFCIDFVDCLLIGFFIWLCAVYGLNLHTGIAFVIALVIVTPIYVLFMTKKGFWIVTYAFSALWSWVFVELIIKGLFDMQLDAIWYGIWLVGAFGGHVMLHRLADERNQLLKARLYANPNTRQKGESDIMS